MQPFSHEQADIGVLNVLKPGELYAHSLIVAPPIQYYSMLASDSVGMGSPKPLRWQPSPFPASVSWQWTGGHRREHLAGFLDCPKGCYRLSYRLSSRAKR